MEHCVTAMFLVWVTSQCGFPSLTEVLLPTGTSYATGSSEVRQIDQQTGRSCLWSRGQPGRQKAGPLFGSIQDQGYTAIGQH